MVVSSNRVQACAPPVTAHVAEMSHLLCVSHAGAQAEWVSLLLATMSSLLFASFTCEASCGFVLQRCLLGLQSAYLLPQPLGQIVLLLGKWVKLIGSRRCVLSAGDLGH